MPTSGYLATCDASAAELIKDWCRDYLSKEGIDLNGVVFTPYTRQQYDTEYIYRVEGLPLAIYDKIADQYIGDQAVMPRTVGVSVELVPYTGEAYGR